jgi:hypothetical protein
LAPSLGGRIASGKRQADQYMSATGQPTAAFLDDDRQLAIIV